MSKEKRLKNRAVDFPEEIEDEDLDESLQPNINNFATIKEQVQHNKDKCQNVSSKNKQETTSGVLSAKVMKTRRNRKEQVQHNEDKSQDVSSENKHAVTSGVLPAKVMKTRRNRLVIKGEKGADHDDKLVLVDALGHDDDVTHDQESLGPYMVPGALRPGAHASLGPYMVPGASRPGAHSSGLFHDCDDDGTVSYDNSSNLGTNPAPYEVNARLVEEDPEEFRTSSKHISSVKPPNDSIPIAEVADLSSTRRIVRGLIIALALAVIVAVVVGVTTTKGRGAIINQGVTNIAGPMSTPPSDNPSKVPSVTPSLFPSFMPTITPWKLGQQIDGAESEEDFGFSVDISEDAVTLAVGAPLENAGMVRTYRFISGSWTALGQNLTSSVPVRWFGEGLALSGDGSTVAVTGGWDEANPFVEVFHFYLSSWARIGRLTNVGYGAYQESVALSRNGRILAIGSPSNGTVQVFERINMTNAWTQLGSKITGKLPSDKFGQSIDLSSDGLTLLAGAPGNNGTIGGGEANVTGTPQTGYAGAYTYSYDTDEWTQVGTGTMQGEVPGDQTGWSVALSGNGLIAAVGAILNDVSGENAGTVRVFKYSTDNLSWLEYGNTIQGEAALDNSGWSLEMSTDGSTIVIGAPGNKGRPQDDDCNPINYNAGQARVYKYSNDTGSSTGGWLQVGADLDGELARDMAGYDVAISSDGNVVVVGAPFNNGRAKVDAGQVSIFYAP